MVSLVDETLVMDDVSATRWLFENKFYKVRRFLDDTCQRGDLESQFQNLLINPLASYFVIRQHLIPDKVKYSQMLDRLMGFGYICIVVGAKGGGKTACVTGRIVPDLLRRGCKVAYVGMPQNVPYFLNDDPVVKKNGGSVSFYYDFFTVPSDCIIVQDESAILENAKNFSDKQQKEKEDILPILRHKGNSIIYISQQFTFLSKRVRDFADMFIIKQFNIMQLLKDNEGNEFPFPSVYRKLIPQDKTRLMFIDSIVGIYSISHDVESWYVKDSDLWGKTFKNIQSEDEALRFIDALFDNGHPLDKVRHLLRLRGFDRPLGWYKNRFNLKNLEDTEKFE